MTWTSRVSQVAAAWDTGIKVGLNAGANLYASEVRRRLMKGYTSGAFSHGAQGVAGRVQVWPAVQIAAGHEVKIGVHQEVPYALFWELGHANLFTRHFERVEVWRPLLLEQAAAIRALVERTLRATLTSMGGTAV